MSRTLHRGLAWLGVAAVVAGSLGAALLNVPLPASAQQLSNVPQTACRAAASGQVATSSRGRDAQWGRSALDTLCNGAETGPGPGECFTYTMTSNSVQWARGSTTWNPDNALRLCAGAVDSGRRVNCFVARVAGGTDWSQAIAQCIAEERTMNVQIAPSASAPRVTAPLQRGEATEEEARVARQAAASTPANLICRGPLLVFGEAVAPYDSRSGFGLQARFQPAASRSNIQPGQCWREGGWGNGALMASDGGFISYTMASGPCTLITSLVIRNGALESIRPIDSMAMYVLNLGRADAGETTIPAKYVGRDTGGGVGGTHYMAERPANTLPPQCPIR